MNFQKRIHLKMFLTSRFHLKKFKKLLILFICFKTTKINTKTLNEKKLLIESEVIASKSFLNIIKNLKNLILKTTKAFALLNKKNHTNLIC